jgi:hypothetical protein
VDIVLGVSMAPDRVRMVLVEGEGGGGVTVDQTDFDVPRDSAAVAADQVIAAILGTRESANESGYRLQSIGVTWSYQAEAAAMRNALAARGIQDVALISTFTAAAALAQAVGSATSCARTALLFIEPTTATLAVVDTEDGSTADVHRKPLPTGDDAALAQLAATIATAESMPARPDGVFLVGSGVDIPSIKPTLEAATRLSVTAPEEHEMALARGAALAAANAQLGAPSTLALPLVEDPVRALAYSAETDDEPGSPPGQNAANPGRRRSRKALAIVGATSIFVGGAVALTLALAVGIRSHVEQRPDISKNVIAPAAQPPQPPQAPSPPPAAPAPQPAAPPASPAPGAPSPNPPQRWLPLHPRDDDHDDHGGWLRRHLGHGILVP